MVHLARGFVERGHRVDLVLGSTEGPFLSEVHSGVELVELGRRSPYAAIPWLLREPANAWDMISSVLLPHPHWVLGCIPSLIDYLRRERPDALLSALNYSNLAALWARRLAGVSTRLVVSERNTLSWHAAATARNRRLPALVARFYPWADAVAAVSDGVADDLALASGLPRRRIVTTYNPVVIPELSERARAPVDHPWFETRSIPVILAAGKLKRQKGFDTLIDAFARLRAQRPARLMVLGSGELHESLERRVRAAGIGCDVEFRGFVENPYPFMSAASLFVLSSRWEGLPGVLIQAMACGCPVVSTDCPSGPSEILQKGEFGALVPVDDATALADAMARTLDHPPDSARLIGRAQDFSLERSTSRYLELLIES